jgi:hypothetical protein
MRSKLLRAEAQTSYSTCAYIAHRVCWVCCVYKCVQDGIGMRTYATRPCGSLCLKTAERT